MYMKKVIESIKKQRVDDKLVISAVSTLDSIEKSINLLNEKLMEWYGLYHPEARKPTFDRPDTSIGFDLDETDLKPIKELHEHVKQLESLKKNIENYIKKKMDCFPNLKTIAGPLVGARLIALAGGIDKLAKLPSSTIQVLGAEKSLFRHLKTGAKPPKYGVLYQHRLVAKAKNKGRIARSLASAIAVCARVDAYKGELVAEKFLKRIEERVEHDKKRK